MKVILGDPGTRLTWGLMKRWATVSEIPDDAEVTALVPVFADGPPGKQIVVKRLSLGDLDEAETDLMLTFKLEL